MIRLDTRLVLASRSPRRSELLLRLGFVFEVIPSDVDEDVPTGTSPPRGVEIVALRKAEHVAAMREEALVLGSDTVVVMEGETLGKPSDASEAASMLARLSDRTHTVYSGIALIHRSSGRTVSAHEATQVTFGKLTDDEIDAYVRTGSPLDKAGAYGIQDDLGAFLVERIQGDYYNVVGLPLRRLYRTIRESFSDLVIPM